VEVQRNLFMITKEETNVFASAEAPAVPELLSPSPSPLLMTAAATTVATVSDWLKGPRRLWAAAVGLLARSQLATHFFVLLPSLYISGVLIYISTGLGVTLCGDMFPASGYGHTYCIKSIEPATNALLGLFGVLAGLTFIVLIPAQLAVYKRWPGVLSLCAWQTGVMGHWYLMTLVLLTLAAGKAISQFDIYLATGQAGLLLFTSLKVLWGAFFPACIVWGLSAEVMAKRRQELSGE
jgi:hypothetical protein